MRAVEKGHLQMRCTQVFAVLLFFLVGTTAVAQDGAAVVELPGHRLWCSKFTILATDALVDDRQAQARARIVAVLDAALASSGQTTSGFPFLQGTRRLPKTAGAAEDVLELQVCYLVNPSIAATSAEIVDIEVPAGKAGLLTCHRSGSRCIDKLQRAIVAMFPSLPDVSSLQWREVATLDRPKSPSQQVQAVTSWQVRPLRNGAEVAVYGRLTARDEEGFIPPRKVMRSLNKYSPNSVVVVPIEQGEWFTTTIALPK
jgi:hypothetical protein